MVIRMLYLHIGCKYHNWLSCFNFKSFGTGPIEGFATTLLIGIITSLFTAIFISKLLVYWDVDNGNRFDFSTYLTKAFRNMSIDF